MIEPPFVKRVEVQEGDLVVLASGETWEIPPGLLAVFVEESTQVLEVGERKVKVNFEKLRVMATRKKG